ncbi:MULTISPECIES: hypothetical protein [Allobacillus]|uniref:DUF4367 domain-containing protein n=1 Tax=Allobacillus salarius TaxID=1955272 RepID=A0A556PQ78_9BACI|nr:hypothetical protein [Allobacillus salarius]TSJ66529.1 hypothetical protein FPQ13_04530 [Allobacillus salarius]
MIDKKLLWMVVVLSLLMVAACSPSEEEAYSDAKSKVKEAVLADQVKEPNKELENFSLYKPEDMSIIEQGPTNVIFQEDDQPYVLFINEFEEPNSKYLYNQLPEEDEVYLSTIESTDAFSYILIQKREENEYELSVGIGGIKMTTMTDLDHLSNESKRMIEIIRSIEEK